MHKVALGLRIWEPWDHSPGGGPTGPVACGSCPAGIGGMCGHGTESSGHCCCPPSARPLTVNQTEENQRNWCGRPCPLRSPGGDCRSPRRGARESLSEGRSSACQVAQNGCPVSTTTKTDGSTEAMSHRPPNTSCRNPREGHSRCFDNISDDQ